MARQNKIIEDYKKSMLDMMHKVQSSPLYDNFPEQRVKAIENLEVTMSKTIEELLGEKMTGNYTWLI